MRLGETEYHFKLATGRGMAESISNMFSHNASQYDLMGVLDECEWDAEDVAAVLNDNPQLTYVHNWQARRTLPRSLVIEGMDNMGNMHTLYIKLDESEPDAFTGEALSLSLTNPSNVPLALSNIIDSYEYTNDDFKDYFYRVIDEYGWSAEAFCDAANQARADGVIYNFDWEIERETATKCVLRSTDNFGNIEFLVIKTM